MNNSLLHGLGEALDRAEENVRTVVLTGAGRALRAGGAAGWRSAERARIGEIQILHGFSPVVLLTPYLLGMKRTKELMLSDELFDIREARSMNSVNRVLPADKVLEGPSPWRERSLAPGRRCPIGQAPHQP